MWVSLQSRQSNSPRHCKIGLSEGFGSGCSRSTRQAVSRQLHHHTSWIFLSNCGLSSVSGKLAWTHATSSRAQIGYWAEIASANRRVSQASQICLDGQGTRSENDQNVQSIFPDQSGMRTLSAEQRILSCGVRLQSTNSLRTWSNVSASFLDNICYPLRESHT